ncbi:LamG-like jellyroll fold domain-containing protein [Paenibacillus hodogayensis]|uniref:LamG-like jellyroll fold domain-containing protein n=1 Tax=Paenibacillus hodogayensis TaxID=279208 RepID=A0ABV5W0I7_9BACL
MSNFLYQAAADAVHTFPNLVCFWDFQEPAGTIRQGQGKFAYRLQEANLPVPTVAEGVFGPYAADLSPGRWFRIPRAECPALHFSGEHAAFTIVAWIRWRSEQSQGCQAVAGIWNETAKQRQYCLFLDLRIWESKKQVCGHVSAEGGPTPGYPFCMTSAIGQTPVDSEWHMVSFTYDGEYARVYLDDRLDEREQWNPFHYPDGLFDGGEAGADFTVGAVDRSGEMGNDYNGYLGGLAIYDGALTEAEITALYEMTMKK